MSQPGIGQHLRSALLRVLLLGVGWWALAEGDFSGWAFGMPVVALAVAASFMVQPPRPAGWSLPGLPRYAAYFLWGSLRGGLDVALRALRPGMPISPGLIRYPLRLPPGPPRALFRVALSLMPGSLCTYEEGEELVIHVMVEDREENPRALRELETQVARLFRLELAPPAPSPGAPHA